MGMVRCVSTPVATQAAHDAVMRRSASPAPEPAPAPAVTEAKPAVDDLMAGLKVADPASLPFPYSLLRPAAGARPGLARATTFDSAMLASRLE
jgi:hypothetical protein